MDINLKGEQMEALRNALVSAFTEYEDLSEMMLFKLNERLERHVARGPMDRVATQVIVWAESQGKLSALIAGALDQVPGNPALRRFALEVSLTSDAPPEGQLESVVLKNVPFQQVSQFRSNMIKRERTVCRVEMPEGKGVGTGFLIGPGTILTNWHVAKILTDENLKPEQVGVRFDYVAGPDGVTVPAGKFYRFAAEWLIDSSPETDLDFAAVRLDGEPGSEKDAQTGETRGWLEYRPHKFAVGEVQLILQHQAAASLNLSAGVVTALNTLHKRITYTANTEGGSSGSPVFTLGWQLVALHHYGHQSGNMGIPVENIWQQLGNKLSK